MKLFCAILMAFTAAEAARAAAMDRFRLANEAYGRKEYEEAVSLYRRCLDEARSAAAHYNLGNAYYKLGETGRAVLHYEKALVLDPGHDEARANLNLVLRDAGLPERKPPLAERFSARLSLNTWSWLCALGFWSALALLLLPRLYGGGNVLTRLGLVFSILLVLAALPAFFSYMEKRKTGVVLKDDTPLRVAPAPESPAAARLQAGRLARAGKSRGEFYFLAAADGKTGWVHSSEFAKIRE